MGNACATAKATETKPVATSSSKPQEPPAKPSAVPEKKTTEKKPQKSEQPVQQDAAPAPTSLEGKKSKKDDGKKGDDVDGELVRQLLLEDDDDLKVVVEQLENADTLKEWWGHLDGNGNGIVSLSEIKKFVRDKQWKVSDPALMQAYKYATARGDDFVQRNEFPRLLRGMVFMNRLWDLFDEMDSSDDRRLSEAEFKAAFEKMKYPLTDEVAAKAFDGLDKNDGGLVLFGEFCRYIARLVSPKAIDFEDNEVEKQEEKKQEAKKEEKAKPKEQKETKKHDDVDGELVRQLLLEDDDDLKVVVEQLENADTLKEWWGHLDGNGNGIVSLSEIKKFVRDKQWKVSDPALMQAYKYATARGDDFVQRNEFPRLLRGMVFMNRLWDLFDEMDSSDDRRLSEAEFKAAFEKMKYPLTDEVAAKAFDGLDKNDGGLVLFGEFCRYIARLVSPKAIDFEDNEVEK